MRRHQFITLIFIYLFTFANPTFAQFAKKTNSLTNFGVGARGCALQASFISFVDDYSAAQWNPAGMAFIDGYSLGGMRFKMPLNREMNFFSLVLPAGKNDRIGLSWQGLLINNIPARTSNTPVPDAYFNNLEESIWLTYSRLFFNRFSIGMNFKYLHHIINDVNSNGWGLDAGIILKITPRMNFGFSIYDVGSSLKWTTEHIDNYEKMNRAGLSYLLKNNWLFAFAVEGENKEIDNFAIGTEYCILSLLKLRMGWQDNRFSAGSGVKLNIKRLGFEFNYAITNNKISNDLSHICDMSISFGQAASRKNEYVIIQCAALNVRSGPGSQNEKITQVFKAQQFLLLDKKLDWLKIEYQKNKFGWIQRDYAEVITL